MALKTIKLRVDGAKLLDRLVGKIRAYWRPDPKGFYYNHEDGGASINGLDLLSAYLEKVPILANYDVSDKGLVTLEFSVSETWGFMSGSGGRAMDYEDQDAIDDIKSDPIGMITGAVHQYAVRVDPYKFAVTDDLDEGEIEEAMDSRSFGLPIGSGKLSYELASVRDEIMQDDEYTFLAYDKRGNKWGLVMVRQPAEAGSRPVGIVRSRSDWATLKRTGHLSEQGKTAAQKGLTADEVPVADLEAGIKVEMEHTNDRTIAQQIALDHFAEDPDYYRKLATIEKESTMSGRKNTALRAMESVLRCDPDLRLTEGRQVREREIRFRAGDILTIEAHKSEPGRGLSYPAMTAEALEDGVSGGWDVYDVAPQNVRHAGDMDDESIYGFSVTQVKRGR